MNIRDLNITREHVIECVTLCYPYRLKGDWEIDEVYYDVKKHGLHCPSVKIRKLFATSFIYSSVLISIEDTRVYLFLKSKGYNVDQFFTELIEKLDKHE